MTSPAIWQSFTLGHIELPHRLALAPTTLGADVAAGLADVEPLGRFALANPDVVERLRTGTSLNEVDPTTLYGGGAAGHTDYPTLAQA